VILGQRGGGFNARPHENTVAPDDPRVELFSELIRAIDARSPKDSLRAIKALRGHSLSIVVLAPKGQGATRR
jgi:hypothetical protein